MMIHKPIFIIGVPRSGTTFLYKVISAHPDVSWFTSNDLVDLIPSSQHESIISNWLKLKFEIGKVPHNEENFFASIAYRKSRGKGIRKPVAIEGETFWREFFGLKYTEYLPDPKKHDMLNKLEKFISKNQKSRFLNKAPLHCMRLFALQKCFPDAKFINIYRDPRSVIASSIKRDVDEGIFDTGISIPNIKKVQNLPQIEKWSWFYKEIMNYILDFSQKQSNDDFFSVKYEELLINPINTVTKILNFSELSIPPSISNLIPPIQETTEKWKDKLTSKDQKIMAEIILPVLQKMNIDYNL